MSKIFNTPFEISLRILIILSEYEGTYISIERISITDFISIYGGAFKISPTNLHGNNPFKFSEFTSRRSHMQLALKNLLADGFVSVRCDENGFTYSITENGLRYSDTFESKYANLLRELVYRSRKYIEDSSERDILNLINEFSVRSIMEGGR